MFDVYFWLILYVNIGLMYIKLFFWFLLEFNDLLILCFIMFNVFWWF